MTTAQDQQSRAEFEALHAKRFAQPLTRWGVTYENAHVRCRWEGWQAARALPAPENVREGEPYDNPAFEDLARTMGVWGTAQAALCAQFFLAGRALPAPVICYVRPGATLPRRMGWETCAATDAGAMAVHADGRALPEGVEPVAWTVAGEVRNWARDFSKYKTQHYVQPVFTAAQVLAMGRAPPFETDAIAVNLMRLAGLNKHKARECEEVVRLVLAAAPRPPAAQEAPTEGTPSYLAQMFGPGPAAQEGA